MYGNKPPHESWNSTSNDSVKEVVNKETQHTKETTMLIRQAVQYAATDNKCLKKIPWYKHNHLYNHNQKCFFVYIN